MKKFISMAAALAMAAACFTPASAMDARTVWYAKWMNYAEGYGLMYDTDHAYRQVTREEYVFSVCVLKQANVAGCESTFTDVNPDEWYSEDVGWAEQNGLTAGIGGGLFGVGQPVTREQMATFIRTAFPDLEAERAAVTFKDSNQVSGWAKAAVDYCSSVGLFSGDENGNFNPKSYITEAECAVVVDNLHERLGLN